MLVSFFITLHKPADVVVVAIVVVVAVVVVVVIVVAAVVVVVVVVTVVAVVAVAPVSPFTFNAAIKISGKQFIKPSSGSQTSSYLYLYITLVLWNTLND